MLKERQPVAGLDCLLHVGKLGEAVFHLLDPVRIDLINRLAEVHSLGVVEPLFHRRVELGPAVQFALADQV